MRASAASKAFLAVALIASFAAGCGSNTLTAHNTTSTLSNLQNLLSMKNTCSGTPCATGPVPTGRTPQPYQTYLVANPVSSPSLSGSSTSLTLFPQVDTAGDVLYFTPALGAYPKATNFVWDFWYMIDQPVWNPAGGPDGKGGPLAMDALEFDFNDYVAGDPGFDYNFSSQCYLQEFSSALGLNGPQWQIWGTKSDPVTGKSSIAWIDSGIPCSPQTQFSPNIWHHLVWTYRIDPVARRTHYISLQIDGVTMMPPSPSPNPIVQLDRAQAHDALEVQFQQDVHALSSPPPSFTEWVDRVQLSFWN